VRPRDGNQVRLVLAPVGFPQEGISFLSAEFAGGLPAEDLVMKMRPSATPALFPEGANLLTHYDPAT